MILLPVVCAGTNLFSVGTGRLTKINGFPEVPLNDYVFDIGVSFVLNVSHSILEAGGRTPGSESKKGLILVVLCISCGI